MDRPHWDPVVVNFPDHRGTLGELYPIPTYGDPHNIRLIGEFTTTVGFCYNAVQQSTKTAVVGGLIGAM